VATDLKTRSRLSVAEKQRTTPALVLKVSMYTRWRETEQEAQLTLWVADRTPPVIQVQSHGTYLRGRRGR